MVSTNDDPSYLPVAAAAVRHAASVSIRTEPAGHSLLLSALCTYVPAHVSTQQLHTAGPCRGVPLALEYP